MTTQGNFVQLAAPLDEENARAFMQSEVAKYQPNFWWKMTDWMDRNTWLVAAAFVAVMDVRFFISGMPIGLGSMTDAFFVALGIVVVPFWIAGVLQKGPARWRVLEQNWVREHLRDGKSMEQFRQEFPGATYRVEVLLRTEHFHFVLLACIIWFELPKPDGSVLRRGVSTRFSNPT